MSENIKLLTITEYNYLLNSAGSNAATESILVEIPTTGWSTESPYTITINVDGIVANYSPIFYLVPAGEEPTEDEIKGTELITDITTEEGSITIEVSEVPTTGFTIALCGFSGKTDFSPADYAELKEQVKNQNKSVDWEQSDETAPDYIQNRPFYIDNPTYVSHVQELVIPADSFEENEYYDDEQNTYVPMYSAAIDCPILPEKAAYRIKLNDKVYFLDSAHNYDGTGYGMTIGNSALLREANLWNSRKNANLNIPFAMAQRGILEGQNLWAYFATKELQTYTLSIDEIQGSVVKIPDKYINQQNIVPVGTIIYEGPYEYVSQNGAEIYNDYDGNKAAGKYSHAEGCDSVAIGDYSHSEGHGTRALDNSAHAEGHSTRAVGMFSHSEGDCTAALGEAAHAEGVCNYEKTISVTNSGRTFSHNVSLYDGAAEGKGSHTEGAVAKTTGEYSHAEGVGTIASGEASHAEGSYRASTTYTYSNGYPSSATWTISHTTASGEASHAEGRGTTASGEASHSEGFGTGASGFAAHAEGYVTNAAKDYSHAEGFGSRTNGIYAHAEGYQADASGDAAHAEGSYTVASGKYSHAEGNQSSAGGMGSHAEGLSTKASGEYQHVQGKYNTEDTANTYAHIIGNGSSNAARSNAHTVDWNGNAWFAGDVYIGGTGQDDETAKKLSEAYATIETLQNQITELNGKIKAEQILVSNNDCVVATKAGNQVTINLIDLNYTLSAGVNILGTLPDGWRPSGERYTLVYDDTVEWNTNTGWYDAICILYVRTNGDIVLWRKNGTSYNHRFYGSITYCMYP